MSRMRMMTVVLTVASLAATATAQQEYNIEYKHLKAGEKVVMHSINHVVGTMQGFGVGAQNMTQKSQQWMSMECLEVDEDGVARIRATFERIAMDVAVGPFHTTFDSADKPADGEKAAASQPAGSPEDIMKQALGASFVGKSLEARVNAKGECLDLKGLQEMFEDLGKNMPGGEAMAKVLKEAMGEDAMKQQWFGNVVWLPKKPIKIGEVWSSEQRTKIGGLGETIVKGKNKLLAVETIGGRRIARIGMTMNMEMAGGEGMKVPGMPSNMKMTMTSLGGTGTWLWDLDRGQMVKLQMASPMEMTVEMANATQPAEGFKMVQKLNYSTVMEIAGDEVAAKLLPTEAPKALTPSPASQPAAKK